MAEACSQVVQALGTKSCKEEELKRLTGAVFQRCDEAGKLAIDDRTAIGRKLVRVRIQILLSLGAVQEFFEWDAEMLKAKYSAL